MNTSHVPEWRIITYTWHKGKTQPPAMHWLGARGISVKGVCKALHCSTKTGLHFRFYAFDRYLFKRWHGEDFPASNPKALMSSDCHDPHFHHSLAHFFLIFLFTLQLWITSPFAKSGFTYLRRSAAPSAWLVLSQCGRGRSITATNDPSPSCLNCLDKTNLAWPATMHFFSYLHIACFVPCHVSGSSWKTLCKTGLYTWTCLEYSFPVIIMYLNE